MKTVITQELLKKERGAKRSGLGLLLLAAVFCLACILLIPVRLLGIGVAVVVAAIALGIWTKVRKQEGRGDIAKAYFRLLPLLAGIVLLFISHNILMAFLCHSSKTGKSVLGMKRNCYSLREIVSYLCRKTNTEVYKCAVLKFLCASSCNSFF